MDDGVIEEFEPRTSGSHRTSSRNSAARQVVNFMPSRQAHSKYLLDLIINKNKKLEGLQTGYIDGGKAIPNNGFNMLKLCWSII